MDEKDAAYFEVCRLLRQTEDWYAVKMIRLTDWMCELASRNQIAKYKQDEFWEILRAGKGSKDKPPTYEMILDRLREELKKRER